MDFATGFATGWAMGKKMFEGTGGEDNSSDPDYQKWLDLPEPNDNQAIFLIRVSNAPAGIGLNVNQIRSPSAFGGYADAFFVDWGDGSDVEKFASAPHSISHTYSYIGEYVITFTNILGYNDFVKPTPAANVIMAKYGDNMCVHSVKSTSGTTVNNFQSHSNLRYIKLPPTTEFNANFFSNCSALRKIDFDGTINILYSMMFSSCNNLDFNNLKFGDISEIPTQCFALCHALKNISLPACTSVGIGAFTNSYNLKSVSLPFCTSVENSAFAFDYNLKSFTSASDCSYGTDCFKGCYKLSPRPDGSTVY